MYVLNKYIVFIYKATGAIHYLKMARKWFMLFIFAV